MSIDGSRTAGSAGAQSGAEAYDDLRYRVFRTFVLSTSIFTSIFTIVEAFVRGPFAGQTFGFLAMATIFWTLFVRARASRETQRPTIVAVSTYVVVFIVIEWASEVTAVGIRVATFTWPVAVMLLSGRRAALAFYGLSSIQAIVMMPLDGPHVAITVINTVGAIFVGGILLSMAWTFDRARQQAMDLANERERALTDALKRAEAAVEARTNFLANMSHEIRTPMNGVLGLSRLLVDEATTDSQRELAHTVVASGQSLLQVLDDILDLSKLDAGALLVDPRVECASEITRQVVALMTPRANDAGLSLQLEINTGTPEYVRLDGHRFRQILSNLVGNAVKFTPHGRILVRVGYADGRLRGEVEDTGIGMDQAQQQRVFRPFQQGDSGTARRFGGTGLGLAICRRLCELMGGQIGVRSQPGVGSVFWFDLPAPPAESPDHATGRLDRAVGPLRVLVAEDNKVNQMVIQRFLRRLGVEPTIVGDGASAIEHLERTAYDLVLMDRHMPNVDGLEATRRIRQLQGARGRTPVVALTASVMAQDRAACLDAGMDAVLPKPVDMAQLEQTLGQYAGCCSQEAQLSVVAAAVATP